MAAGNETTTTTTHHGVMSRIREAFSYFDVRMLPVKVALLLYGFVLGSLMPFLFVFFKDVGMSHSRAGLLLGFFFGPSSLAGPLWGMLADYTGRRKLILALLCVGAAIPLFSMPFVAHAIYPNPHANATTFHDDIQQKVNATTLFGVLAFMTIVASVFAGPLPGYIDSIAMNFVKTSKTKESYGTQRLFGSLGFALASLISGAASDNFQHQHILPHLSHYTAVFLLFLPSVLLLIPFGLYIINNATWDTEQEDENEDCGGTNTQGKSSVFKQMLNVCSRLEVVIMMISVLISGLACNLFNGLGLKLAQDAIIGASDTILSFIFVIATGAEVLLFPFTTSLMKRLGGPTFGIALGIFSYFVRYIVMSHTSTLWLMLIIQLLHAFGFALTWAAVMEYLSEACPKEILMSMFCLFQSIMFGIGAITANIVGGFLYQAYGGKKLFQGKAILDGVWSVFLVAYFGWLRFKGKKESKRLEVELSNKQNGGVDTCPEIGIENTPEIVE